MGLPLTVKQHSLLGDCLAHDGSLAKHAKYLNLETLKKYNIQLHTLSIMDNSFRIALAVGTIASSRDRHNSNDI